RLRVGKKRSRQTSCLLEDCSLQARKVLRDHVHPTTNGSATQGLPRSWLLRFVWFVSFIWFEPDKPEQPDEPNTPEVLVCLLSHEFAAVGGGEILVGTKGDDSSRIDVVVGDVVVPLDVVEVHGVGDAVGLIEVFEVAEEVGVVDDPPEVALEMAVVDGIEAYEGDEQAPIGFDEL